MPNDLRAIKATARDLLRRFGSEAWTVAANAGEERSAQGQHARAHHWLRVMREITLATNAGRGNGEAMH